MLIIPAIDLRNGKCVRLLKGEEGTETVFSDSPVEVARRWEASGARLIHVVDLDGAFSGEPINFDIIREISNSVSASVQVGGGIRNIEAVEKYLEAGISRTILGTAAFQNPAFLAEACKKFPEKIAVGVDTKTGKIAVKGWKEVMDLDTPSVLSNLKMVGVSMIIHTDVDRDGTMSGVSVNAVEEFIKSSPLPVVASGGISSMGDLEKLSALERFGLIGAIVGKSIYTGKINLEEAIEKFS